MTPEILDTLLPERVYRANPRVVKKPVSKFRSKKLEHRETGKRIKAPTFRILTTAFSLNLTVLGYGEERYDLRTVEKP